jgi:hypothetical protein
MNQTAEEPLSELGPRICAAIVKTGHAAEWNASDSTMVVDGVRLLMEHARWQTRLIHRTSMQSEPFASKAKKLNSAHVQPIIDLVFLVKAWEERAGALAAIKEAAADIAKRFSREGVEVSAHPVAALHYSNGPTDKVNLSVEFKALTVAKAQAVLEAMKRAMEAS